MIQFKCPVCKKRIFDSSNIPKEQVCIQAKCPHCNKFVDVLLKEENIKINIPSKGKNNWPNSWMRTWFLSSYFYVKGGGHIEDIRNLNNRLVGKYDDNNNKFIILQKGCITEISVDKFGKLVFKHKNNY